MLSLYNYILTYITTYCAGTCSDKPEEYTTAMAATDFDLPEETVKLLVQIARTPVLVKKVKLDSESPELTIAQ